MMAGLIDALDRAGRDEAVRAIVLAGAGRPLLRGRRHRGPQRGSAASAPGSAASSAGCRRQAHRLIPLLRHGAGARSCARCRAGRPASASSWRWPPTSPIAADDARFWEPFAERGFTPDSGATWLLPRLVGAVRARELLLLGRSSRGAEAAEWGLSTAPCPPASSTPRPTRWSTSWPPGPTVALGLTKWLLHAGADVVARAPSARTRRSPSSCRRAARTSARGSAAFREKRPPDFSGPMTAPMHRRRCRPPSALAVDVDARPTTWSRGRAPGSTTHVPAPWRAAAAGGRGRHPRRCAAGPTTRPGTRCSARSGLVGADVAGGLRRARR